MAPPHRSKATKAQPRAKESRHGQPSNQRLLKTVAKRSGCTASPGPPLSRHRPRRGDRTPCGRPPARLRARERTFIPCRWMQPNRAPRLNWRARGALSSPKDSASARTASAQRGSIRHPSWAKAKAEEFAWASTSAACLGHACGCGLTGLKGCKAVSCNPACCIMRIFDKGSDQGEPVDPKR